jgi:hypothetical protein
MALLHAGYNIRVESAAKDGVSFPEDGILTDLLHHLHERLKIGRVWLLTGEKCTSPLLLKRLDEWMY